MHQKIVKGWQSREGSPSRRLLEFEVVRDQVKRRKAAFTKRLKRRIMCRAGHAICKGNTDHKGYPRFTFWYRDRWVTILACRIFLILQLAAPIPKGREAAHTCKLRRCVAHIESQPYTINARSRGKYAGIPF